MDGDEALAAAGVAFQAEPHPSARARFRQLADYHLRRQGLWSAKGKAIPRALHRADLDLCARYCQSFDNLFKLGDAQAVIQLAEDLLRAGGGPLFEGYRADAPASWRKPRDTAV